MKVSLQWLRELVELPPSVPDLVDLLTLAGVEVEGVENHGVAIENVVVARIAESVPHPDADRLSVCQVEDGSATPRQIVCGAKNYRVGDKVPLALPGAVLGPDFKIKVGKLRGVESQGMLCSAEELGLAKGADGLLILAPDSPIGAPLSEVFPSDTVLDLEITPNRADLLCHTGIAREIAALRGTRPNDAQESELQPRTPPFIASAVEVEPRECRLYTVLEISNVQVAPSPETLRRKLEAVGQRAINNIVDVTNFQMLSLGQPLHAFDADRVEGDIRVRYALEGEEFAALDGRTYRLGSSMVVIADERRALALAGVMGGADSGVTDATRNILIESAHFEAANIRRTSRALGLSSESSYRFERGVDLAGVLRASEEAAALITKIAGGEVGDLSVGTAGDSTVGLEPGAMLNENSGPVFTHTVALRPNRVAALLGAEISAERIDAILSGFALRKAEAGWEIPSFRPDLTREIDLIEEIARVVGIENIPGRVRAQFAPVSATDRAYDRAMDLRRALVAHGFAEARTLTLIGAQTPGFALSAPFPENLRCVKNPMNDEQSVLRPSLLPGLLEALRGNVRAGAKTVRLFEVGRTFASHAAGGNTDPGHAEEGTHLGCVLTGPLAERTWRSGEGNHADLYDLKGVLAAVFGPDTIFAPKSAPGFAQMLLIEVAGRGIGCAGQLWPRDARALDATAPVFFAEVDLGALPAGQADRKYREIPRFPATARDIALLAPLPLAHEAIVSELRAAREPLLADIELFDVFSDPSGTTIPVEKKSLAYSLTYRSTDRTLTADEVNAAHGRLKERLKTALAVTLRE